MEKKPYNEHAYDNAVELPIMMFGTAKEIMPGNTHHLYEHTYTDTLSPTHTPLPPLTHTHTHTHTYLIFLKWYTHLYETARESYI